MREMVKENRGQISAVDQIAQFEGSATNPKYFFTSSSDKTRSYSTDNKKEIKSEVETALIRDCFLNLFSLAKIIAIYHELKSQGTSPLVSFVMMSESEKNDGFSGFVYFKFENEFFEDMDSSLTFKFIPQRFIVGRVQDSNISSTDLNLMKGPFLLCSNSPLNSSFNGSSSTGCQSIFSQNSQSSSVISPVCLYLTNMSRFINLITALTKNSESSINSESNFNSSFMTDSLISITNNNIDSEYINTFSSISTSTSCEDARYKMQDTSQTGIRYLANVMT